MSGFRVGLGTQPVNSRYSPTAFARADMLTATASGANSYWIGDHLNSLLPRSIATPRYLGAAKLVPKIDATLEPWTMLGHLASRNRFARLRLGVGVTDASRRNPAGSGGGRQTRVKKPLELDESQVRLKHVRVP
jgi:phthiodiolone/phenolphthiodiolone dimycocerosates ketoreductase